MSFPATLHPLAIGEARLARLVAPGVTVAAVLAGYAASFLAAGPAGMAALVFPVALLPLLLWRKPHAGVLGMFGATVMVEQFPYHVGARAGAATSRIPFFHAVQPGQGVTPAEALLLALVLVWLMKVAQTGSRLLPRSILCVCTGVVLAFVTTYVGVGLARHGLFKIALWEIRPFLYLAVMYVLASSLLVRVNATRALMWTVIVGAGFKGLYGLYFWWGARNTWPRPEAVLAHEESFFFGLFVFLTVALWMWDVRGRMRASATALLPVVVLADMANSRRTAWAILGAGLVLLFATGYARLPHRRRLLRRLTPVLLVVCAAYFPLFWNRSDTVAAAPARAARSIVAPDHRDESSNDYREIEAHNLELAVDARSHLGAGFGLPIDYQIEIVDISAVDPMIAYVPHDTVLWIWMRMGLLGAVAFWMMIAAGFIKACQMTRLASVDREAAVLGAVVACGLVGYVVMGKLDLGFAWFRIALCMGVLLGALEARCRVLEIVLSDNRPGRS